MVHNDYTLNLSSTELNQLLKICYGQQAVNDAVAITLIAKINEVLLSKGGLRNLPNSYTQKTTDFAALESQAAEAYYRYRDQELGSNGTAYAASAPGNRPSGATAPATPYGPFADSTALNQPPSQDLAVPSPSTTAASLSKQSSADPMIQSIARSLDRMATYLAQQNPLGFSEEALHQVIYCDDPEGRTWYYRDKTLQQPVLISAPVLTCKAQRLEFVQQEGTWKLKFYVLADRPYCLEANYNSAFSKALLLALASLELSQLKQPISLEVVPSASPGSLTCRVYSQGVQIMHYFGANPQWREVAHRAITQVEAATQGAESQAPTPAPVRSA